MRYVRLPLTMLAGIIMLAAGCTSIPEAETTADSLSGLSSRGALYTSEWPAHGTFSWAGPEFWPDRIDGWHTVDGKLLCQGSSDRPLRHITLASPMLGESGESFSIQIDTGTQTSDKGNYAGFLLGLPSALPYPAATTSTLGRVIFAGITGAGNAVVAANPSNERLHVLHKSQTNSVALPKTTRLILRGIAFRDRYTLVLSCRDAKTNREYARASLWDIPPALLKGHIALATGPSRSGTEGPFWFQSMRLNGEKLITSDAPPAGPLLGAWYHYNATALQMHVESFPVSPDQRDAVTLSTWVDDCWKPMGTAPVAADGSATLRIPNWPYNKPTPYRLELPLTYSDTITNATYTGVICPDPTSASLVTISLTDSAPPPENTPSQPGETALLIAAADPHALLLSHGIHDCTTPERRFAWTLAYAGLGRERTCLGAFPGPATCGGLAVVKTESATAPPRSPDELWDLWAGAEAHVDIAPDTFIAVARANQITNEPSGIFDSPHICPTLNATNGYPFVRYDRHRQTIEYHRVELSGNRRKVRGDLPGWPVFVPLRHPDYERPYGYLTPTQVAGIQDPLIQVIDQDTNTSLYLERVRGHVALPRVFSDGTYTLRIGAPEQGLMKQIANLAPASLGETETARVTF